MKENLLGLLLFVLEQKGLKIESGYVRYECFDKSDALKILLDYKIKPSYDSFELWIQNNLKENYTSIEYIKWLSFIGNIYLKSKDVTALRLESEIKTNKGLLILKYDFDTECFYFLLETEYMKILKRNVETLLKAAFEDKYKHGLIVDGCLLSKDVYTMDIKELEVIALMFGLELADLYIEDEAELLQKVNIYISKVIFNENGLIPEEDIKAVLNLIRIGNAYKKMDRIKYRL